VLKLPRSIHRQYPADNAKAQGVRAHAAPNGRMVGQMFLARQYSSWLTIARHGSRISAEATERRYSPRNKTRPASLARSCEVCIARLCTRVAASQEESEGGWPVAGSGCSSCACYMYSQHDGAAGRPRIDIQVLEGNAKLVGAVQRTQRGNGAGWAPARPSPRAARAPPTFWRSSRCPGVPRQGQPLEVVRDGRQWRW
jgi:hypothetical protein